jgi:hypothetical protein
MKPLLGTTRLLGLLVAAAACGAVDRDVTPECDIRIVVVTHGQSSDPFWSVGR